MDTEKHPGNVAPETIEAEKGDANRRPVPDRRPTAHEEELAEEQTLDPHVAKAYEEAIERGANVKGEGEIGG